MAKGKNTIRRIALAAVASCAVLIIGALYLLAFPVDLSSHHESIESLVESRTGRKVRLKEIILKALPTPDLTINGVEAFQDNEEVFKAGHMRARVSLLSLILRKPVIERFELKGASLFIKRNREGRINIEDLLGKGKEKTVINSLYVEGGDIKIFDETAPASFEITDINGYLYGTRGGFTYGAGGRLVPSTMITFNGTGNPTEGVFSGTGAVEGLEIGIFNPYFKKAQGSSIKGTANASFSYSFGKKDSLKSVLMYKGLKADFPAVLNSPLSSSYGSAILDIAWAGKTSILLKEIRIAMPEFSINGSFSVEGPKGKESFSLDIATTPVPFKTFKGLIPVKIISREASSRIKDITPIDGHVTVRGFSMTGPFEELKDGTVFEKPERFRVNTLLDALEFGYAPLKENFSDFNGSVSLSKGVLSIQRLSGRYNKEAVEDLNADLSELTGPLLYRASVKASLDAEETLEAVKDLSKAHGLTILERVEKLKAGGDVDLSLDVKGSLRGKAPFVYSGTAGVKNGNFSYRGLPGSYESVYADIGFDDRRVTINEARGSEGESSLRVTGFVDDYLKTPFVDLSAEGEVTGDTVKKFLPPEVAAKLSIDGRAILKASGSGTVDSFSAAAYIDTTGAGVEYKNVIKKAPDYTLSLEGYVTRNGNSLAVKRAALKFGKSSVSMGGDFLLDRPVYSFLVQSKELRIVDLENVSPFLISGYESEGLVTFSIGSTRKTAEAAPSYEGVALVKDARFKSTLVAKPVERINAAMMIEGNRANVKIGGMEVGETRISGTVDVPDVAGRVVNFNFTSPRLNTDDLIPKDTGAWKIKDGEKPPGEAPVARPVTGSGRITIAEGTAWGHLFSNLTTDVEMTADAVHLNPFSLAVDGGTAAGYFTYYKDKKEALLFDTFFTVNEVDLETMLSALGVKKKVIAGRLTGDVRLAERRGAEPFLEGLSGSASLTSRRGRLWKGVILTKIFSIVNILSIDELFKEGLPYKTLSGDFLMDHGIITTEKTSFDSDSLRMSAVGAIDVPERKIDAVIALSPFVTIDKIISNIPLAGWIITGKDKSVVSMYFGVEGPLGDPLILPKPITGLEKGILGIFERLLKTPERILNLDEK